MDNHGAEGQVSVTVHDYEYAPNDSDGDSSPSSSNHELFRDFMVNGMLSLYRVEERGYDEIKKIFLDSMALYGEGTDLVAIHNISYTGGSGKARLEGFRSLRQAVAARRGGDANVQYGWYGGSRAEICDVLSYGFCRCANFVKGLSHGVGVYLSPDTYPILSVLRAKEDENGIRHMLLCRIILGKTETIPAGSEQVYPSSTDFDSGIDNPLTPRKYIIWRAYMNSHILPICVYSFKFPSLTGNHPIKLSTLFNALSELLHPSKTGFLNCYNDFREHKIDMSELIRRLRRFVSDDVFISAVKLCRDEFSGRRRESMSPRKLVPAANGVDRSNYPVPLASHEDVVNDPTLFINTLRSFHFAMATKFQIPVIGGKELNLHVLYVEVTKRGGYVKVVTEKKWREISLVFDFSPTTTSASYALRNHYSTLLLHYEHVYFFSLQPSTFCA